MGRWRTACWPLPAPEWLDGMALLYNPLSGRTHLLSPLAMALLEELAEGPADEAALAARLEVAEQSGENVRLARLCWELAELGLLDPDWAGLGGRV